MYDYQFKKWKLSKNMSENDKDKQIEQIKCKKGPNAFEQPLSDKITDPQTWSKLRRHAKAKKREEKRNTTTERATSSSRVLHASHGTDSCSSSLCCYTSTQDSDIDNGANTYLNSDTLSDAVQAVLTPISSLEDSSNDENSTVLTPNTSDAEEGVISSSTSAIAGYFNNKLRIVPPIATDPKSFNMDLVMRSLHSYCKTELQNLSHGVELNEYMKAKSSSTASQFWYNVKQGIYLLKVSAPNRAWPTLEQACKVPAEALVEHPIDFMRELFATLSPVNTRIYPRARIVLLRYLDNIKLGDSHPIRIITHQLLRDGHCREFSQRALSCMLDLFVSALGRSSILTFEVQRAFITLLRRDSQYDMAAQMATELLDTTKRVFGATSEQARLVATELAHIHIDKGAYVPAAMLCRWVICQSTSAYEFIGPRFHDARAVYAMEDLANIHIRSGEINTSIIWLEQALHDAWTLWTGSVATMHIVDKLDPLLRLSGREDDADWYKASYASNIKT